MKRLLLVSIISGFFIYLFLFLSPLKNQSYAGAICTAANGSCQTPQLCSANGRSIGKKDCTGTLTCCNTQELCASPNTCKSSSSCATANRVSGFYCSGTNTTCCKPTCAGSCIANTPSAISACGGATQGAGTTTCSGSTPICCHAPTPTLTPIPTTCASTATSGEACMDESTCIMQGVTRPSKTGCAGGKVCCYSTGAATVCDSALRQSCKSVSACTSSGGTVNEQLSGCILGSSNPVCCQAPPSCSSRSGTCKTTGECSSSGGVNDGALDCGSNICCIPPVASSCTQCPATYDQFWQCEFRVGDIPPDKVCCHEDGPFGARTYSPLVPCGSANTCEIPGALPETCKACSPGSTDPSCQFTLMCDTFSCQTALGKIDVSIGGLVNGLFAKILSVVGGIAVLLIIISGYKIMTSQGNPEGLKGAKEQLTAAIVGLIFVIFSLVFLQVIGVNILNLSGFTP